MMADADNSEALSNQELESIVASLHNLGRISDNVYLNKIVKDVTMEADK